MVKKLSILFLMATLILAACGTLQVTMDQTPAPGNVTITPELAATFTQPAARPALSPTLEPKFSDEIRFTMKPGVFSPQRAFPGRVRQVYAVWDYSGMRPGLTVRREWYHGGALWLQHEEPWDFAKYGAQGTISDISVYDFDAGLEPGDYYLILSIDGQRQQFANEAGDFTRSKFSVIAGEIKKFASPGGQWSAIIDDPQKIVIQDAGGTQRELLSAREISTLAWFPDGRHIVYSNVVRPQAYLPTNIGIRGELWVADVSSGEQHQIATTDENLQNPLISPDGHYIATTSSGYRDACLADSKLAFIELDNNLKRIGFFALQDFAGISPGTSDSIIYTVGGGAWQDNTHFKIGLDWTCMPTDNPYGVYLFDLAGRQATRTGDLSAQP